MASTKFNEMSTEKLLEQQKLSKIAIGALIGSLTALLVMVILLTIKKGFGTVSMSLGIIPFAMIPIVVMNWSNMKEIQKELNSRESSGLKL
ncbi:redox-active disulfide protein 2 [Fibrella forsythiae]|uniref:Redox-active disulfide protein 2 n=1 Tax=Fibrella forsythiae TaxID=2817061 RepID=A0ABS3JLJ5_9BACT|nr:redox-active disulfide protein 2 [Fibrella forsythiae]MBO0949772.1 redox-active disulfide protein 2 [Fibrella forsythiae]